MTSFYSTRVKAPAYNTSATTACNEVVSLNPPGRDTTDDVNATCCDVVDVNPSLSGILRPKKTLNVATLKVRTLASNSKLHELIADAELHNIDILCIQEHRDLHDDIDIKFNDIGKWSFVAASATKNSINATVGGVGILLSPKAKASLNSVSKISSRMIIASFNSNPALTILSCYRVTARPTVLTSRM